MNERNLVAILIASVVVLSVSLTPVVAQNASMSQAAVGGQSSDLPAIAPLNPAWLAFEQNLTAGKAIVTTTATGNPLGYIPGPVNLNHLKGKKASYAAQTQPYPESYDLRKMGKVTSVKEQNPYGTCWAFGAFGSLESFLLPAQTRDFSEWNLVMNSGFDIPWSQGGNQLMSLAYLARWSGPVNEVDDPYPGGSVRSVRESVYAVQKHTQDVYFLPERTSSTDNDNIKWGLMKFGGLDARFYWANKYYSMYPPAYYNPENTNLNHEVTLVGWDDNYPATNFKGFAGAPPGNGAFIVKNSWGKGWGDRGYFYISYYDTSLQQSTAFTAESASNYYAVYQYDPLGWVNSAGYLDETAWAANVFPADSSANLITAVGFYTTDMNMQYEVYIHTDPTSGPLGGREYVGPKGTLPLAGYHTVKLASPVVLSAGQRFSVVLKFITSGYDYPLALECAVPGYSSKATASFGQSYVSQDGSIWVDIKSYYPTANVCIKAFTSQKMAFTSQKPDEVKLEDINVGNEEAIAFGSAFAESSVKIVANQQ